MTETPRTVPAFRRWLRKEIEWLDDPEPDEQQFYDAVGIIQDVRRIAAAMGLPEVVKICSQIKTPALALSVAQEVLSECLAALKKSNSTDPDPDWFTPPQVAKKYRVSPDTVPRWIKGDALSAVKVGKGTRPRYRVSADALKASDAKRPAETVPEAPAARRRPKKTDLLVTRFSSRR